MTNHWLDKIKNKKKNKEENFVCLNPKGCMVPCIDCIFSCHMPGAEDRKKKYEEKHGKI